MTRKAFLPSNRLRRAEPHRLRERLRVVRCSVLLSTVVLVCACSPDQPMAGSTDPTPTSPTPASSSAPTPLTTSVTTTLLPALPIVHPQPPGCGPEISLLFDGLYWESGGDPPTLDYGGGGATVPLVASVHRQQRCRRRVPCRAGRSGRRSYLQLNTVLICRSALPRRPRRRAHDNGASDRRERAFCPARGAARSCGAALAPRPNWGTCTTTVSPYGLPRREIEGAHDSWTTPGRGHVRCIGVLCGCGGFARHLPGGRIPGRRVALPARGWFVLG